MSEKSAQTDQTAPKGKKTLILILVAVLLLIAGGGAAAWMLLNKPADAEEDGEMAVAPAKRKAPVFVPLDQFTVNLADDGGERFAQVAMVLEVEKPDTGDAVKAHMPAIRNSILMLLSSKYSKELLTVPGKEKLAAEVAEQSGILLGWEPPEAEPPDEGPTQRRRTQRPRSKPNPVVAVHFAHFIVQ